MIEIRIDKEEMQKKMRIRKMREKGLEKKR